MLLLKLFINLKKTYVEKTNASFAMLIFAFPQLHYKKTKFFLLAPARKSLIYWVSTQLLGLLAFASRTRPTYKQNPWNICSINGFCFIIRAPFTRTAPLISERNVYTFRLFFWRPRERNKIQEKHKTNHLSTPAYQRERENRMKNNTQSKVWPQCCCIFAIIINRCGGRRKNWPVTVNDTSCCVILGRSFHPSIRRREREICAAYTYFLSSLSLSLRRCELHPRVGNDRYCSHRWGNILARWHVQVK